MSEFQDALKDFWSVMFGPPWPTNSQKHFGAVERVVWLFGWVLSICGLVGGALIAPSIVQRLGIPKTQVQELPVIATALVAAFVVQLLGFIVGIIVMVGLDLTRPFGGDFVPASFAPLAAFTSVGLVFVAAVAYGIYIYLTWVGPGQSHVTIAFVGGLAVKVVVIPAIKALVTGAAMRWFFRWLRGDKAKAA